MITRVETAILILFFIITLLIGSVMNLHYAKRTEQMIKKHNKQMEQLYKEHHKRIKEILRVEY